MNRLFSLLLLGVALAEGVLEPPSNIRTTVQATSVELLWDPVSDATGYMVIVKPFITSFIITTLNHLFTFLICWKHRWCLA